jgi:hypothetical protein
VSNGANWRLNECNSSTYFGLELVAAVAGELHAAANSTTRTTRRQSGCVEELAGFIRQEV